MHPSFSCWPLPLCSRTLLGIAFLCTSAPCAVLPLHCRIAPGTHSSACTLLCVAGLGLPHTLFGFLQLFQHLAVIGFSVATHSQCLQLLAFRSQSLTRSSPVPLNVIPKVFSTKKHRPQSDAPHRQQWPLSHRGGGPSKIRKCICC